MDPCHTGGWHGQLALSRAIHRNYERPCGECHAKPKLYFGTGTEGEWKEEGGGETPEDPQTELNVCHCCKPDHRFFLFCTLVETKQLPAGKAAVAAEGPRGYSKRLRNPLTVHRVPCESKK